jgi:hypothetical protein
MNTCRISLDDGRSAYRPGETISGVVEWNGETAPGQLELRLFWYTQGKGTQDVGVAATQGIDTHGPDVRRPFRLVAPAHPPSLSGKLVSVCWAIELIGGDEVLRQELVIGPGAREVVLPREP